MCQATLRIELEQFVRHVAHLGFDARLWFSPGRPTEPIESRLVARRIAAAQQRFARGAVVGGQAESAEEWLRRNDPDA